MFDVTSVSIRAISADFIVVLIMHILDKVKCINIKILLTNPAYFLYLASNFIIVKIL